MLSDDERALFMISVAAELAGMHPQTLRMYERRGLLRPQRTAKNTRRYSARDVERLRRIQALTELGLNLAASGAPSSQEQMDAMAAELRLLHARLDEATLIMRREVERIERSHRLDLVPVHRGEIVHLGHRRRRA